MAASVVCPQCQQVLKSANPIPAGKKVKCPKCASVFVTPSPEEEIVACEEATDADDNGVVPSQAALKPAAKTRIAPDIEEEEEEAPPSKKRRRDEDEEPDDEDDRPRARRKSRDEEEDEDDRPRKKPRRQKKGKGLLIGLLVGGGFMLLLCAGLGSWLIYYLVFGSSNPLIGTWEPTINVFNVKMEFRADGTMHQKVGGLAVSGKYRVLDSSTVEFNYDGAEVNFGGKKVVGQGRSERKRYSVSGDQLTIQDENGQGAIVLRRVK